jgi:hypothetical protein
MTKRNGGVERALEDREDGRDDEVFSRQERIRT